MNKTAIKNYAIWARVNLIEATKQRAYQYEITKDNITDAGADVVSGKPLSKDEKEQRKQLIDQINRKGFDQVMEEVAYTWFNRFIALRFMEVNGYLPTKIRVFTDSEGNFKPEILKEALTVELPIDKARVMELLEKQDNEELYKMLLIAQCNELSNGLPDMFEVISNYTELLFPNNLLKEDSILGEMVNSIPEEDWTDAVQIIGWLYQYYFAEPKDELINAHKTYKKTDIPYVTQLFTPDWIVRYMVENTLGRLWYEGHPNEEIKKEWKYYLDEAQQGSEIEEHLKAICEDYKSIKPEDIKIIDPCMGSGHILVYAFDVLMQIYTSAGWSERDAAESILENNIFGLDIDDRAGQLAYFAVIMKARKYNRRILTKNIRPKVFSIQESNNVKIDAWWRLGPEEDIARRLVQDFTDAKEYGSILNLSVTTEELQALRSRLDDIDEMSTEGNLISVIQSDEITRQLYPLIDLAEVMIQKYDVLVTNPPYMNSSLMPSNLKNYITENYKEYKTDLFAVFIVKALNLTKKYGNIGILAPYVWMFISSYELLRKRACANNTITSLVQLEYNAFEAACVPVAAFTMCKDSSLGVGEYIKLSDFRGSENQAPKLLEAIDNRACGYRYTTNQKCYLQIPGSPIAYWSGASTFSAFNGKNVADYYMVRNGISTGDNLKYLRLWHEIDKTADYWKPCNKGGQYRKWYGNNEYSIYWKDDGYDIKNALDEKGRLKARLGGVEHSFEKGIEMSRISSGELGFRYSFGGFVYESSTNDIFSENDSMLSLLAFFNSCIVGHFLNLLNPTINIMPEDIRKLPYKVVDDVIIENLSTDCIQISKNDWDSYETSWDFNSHPLI